MSDLLALALIGLQLRWARGYLRERLPWCEAVRRLLDNNLTTADFGRRRRDLPMI